MSRRSRVAGQTCVECTLTEDAVETVQVVHIVVGTTDDCLRRDPCIRGSACQRLALLRRAISFSDLPCSQFAHLVLAKRL